MKWQTNSGKRENQWKSMNPKADCWDDQYTDIQNDEEKRGDINIESFHAEIIPTSYLNTLCEQLYANKVMT